METWIIGLITAWVGFIVGFALGWICAFGIITRWRDQ